MEAVAWITAHWFDLFQTAAITAGLCFTAWSLRLDIRTRRADHLLEITKQHREIWTELYRRPELARVRDAEAVPHKQPITPKEELFIGFLILHLNASYHAMKARVFIKPEGLRKDVRRFFSRPLVKTVWEKVKLLQDERFVRFIDDCQRSAYPSNRRF